MDTTLTVWSFDTPDGAERASARVNELQEEGLMNIEDGCIVEWPEGQKKPKTKQFLNTTAAGAATGGFWGLLFGIIFFVPIIGTVFGAALGAVTGAFTDVGISNDFIDEVRSKVKEGTSALFLLTSEVVIDKVIKESEGLNAHLVSTNLPTADENKLRDMLTNDD